MADASRTPMLITTLHMFCIITQYSPLRVSTASTGGGCIESERRALLAIKADMYQPPPDQHTSDAHWLSSWSGGGDCCAWQGVGCDNVTGHVTELDLKNVNPWSFDTGAVAAAPASKLNPSLLGLVHLEYLDLSMNNFGNVPIPEFIGSLADLEYLNLSYAKFSGAVPPQIGNLSKLSSLDLHCNLDNFFFVFDYAGLSVDRNFRWISRMYSLQYLDMSGVDLSLASEDWVADLNVLPSLSVLKLSVARLESFPARLEHVNFTSLATLDLSSNLFGPDGLPDWLFNITSLEHLTLDDSHFVDMKFLQMSIGSLGRLRSLSLGSCNIAGQIPDTLGRLVQLEVLDLGVNQLDGSIPETVGNLSRMRVLILSYNNITGVVPKALGKLYDLEYLGLTNNSIGGQIPGDELGRLCKLNHLQLSYNRIRGDVTALVDGLSSCSSRSYGMSARGSSAGLKTLVLGYNNLSGTVTRSLGKLSSLIVLDLSFNSFAGNLTEAHFSNLSNLRGLFLSFNHLELSLGEDWVPPFDCLSVKMCSCRVGPRFPAWLRTQRRLQYLCISEAGISDDLPPWLWDSNISILNASYNTIAGRLPPSLQGSMDYLDLSHNSLDGLAPLNVVGDYGYRLKFFYLSHNRLSGSVPLYFCNFTQLRVLDLSNNNFSGALPLCQTSTGPSSSSLEILDLSNNNLSGRIPRAIGSYASLKSLHLRNNSLAGEIPPSLAGCRELVVLDLGENRLTGRIPEGIGESLVRLKVLRLRSNFLRGGIPIQLSRLASLQVLDLACNHLSSSLPPSLGGLEAMIATAKVNRPMYTIEQGLFDHYSYYRESLSISTKESSLVYTQILSLVVCIDVSGNSLHGEIPEEITRLSGLVFLNLSGNNLVGRIPEKIGEMSQLQSLDLSANGLSGTIPPGMSSLYFLSSLKLSRNNLRGRIPAGGQLQTFSDGSYASNLALCGPPLPRCPGDEPFRGPSQHGGDQVEDGKSGMMMWLSYSVEMGFILGFWGVIGTLMTKPSVRIPYFHFIDEMCDWVVHAELGRNLSRSVRSMIGNEVRQGGT